MKLLDGGKVTSKSLPVRSDGLVELMGEVFSPNLEEQSMVPYESEKGPFVVLFVNLNSGEGVKPEWPDCVWLGDIDLNKYEGL